VYATDTMCAIPAHRSTGRLLSDGKFIAKSYKQLVDDRLHISVDEFENQIKEEITVAACSTDYQV